MTKTSRYFGKVCDDHKDLGGERYTCNGRCVKCALDIANKRKTRNRYWLINFLKDKQCEHCGTDDSRVLSFDHIDPNDKVSDIATMSRQGARLDDLRKEVAKCRVLCHNCHAIVSLEQQDSYHGKLQPLTPEQFKDMFGCDY